MGNDALVVVGSSFEGAFAADVKLSISLASLRWNMRIRSQSRGRLWLRSADPAAVPALDPQVFAEPRDLEVLTDSVKLVREISRKPALDEWRKAEWAPGDQVSDRDAIRDYVRRQVLTYHHQIGTCRMGVDASAVVDPELRVRGIDGLRVVDAPIMPDIPSGNTNAPTIMIAEKGADLLLGR